MQSEKPLSETESLRLIQQMISMAKKEQQDDGRGWILWGWLLFFTSLLTIVNLHTHWAETFFFWNVFGIVTILVFGYELVRKFFFKKTDRVKTYTGDLFSKLNTGFFICLIFVIVAINVGTRAINAKYGGEDFTFVTIGFALLIDLYAFWILIYGTALNFRPSIIGAYIAWGFGIIGLVARDFEWVMVCQAFAVLAGYIVPGHLANKEFRRIKAEKAVARV